MAQAVNNAALMGTGVMDPRNSYPGSDLIDADINQQSLEIYEHYAAIERARELLDVQEVVGSPYTRLYRQIFAGKKQAATSASTIVEGDAIDGLETISRDSSEKAKGVEKSDVVTTTSAVGNTLPLITSAERDRAYRALRTASWQGVFFLITTDILGPSSAPYAFSQLGFAGGCLTYTILFVLAVLGGQILWRLYLALDSSRFPVKQYADIGERLFGKPVRHFFNILQSLQLILNVGLITLGSAQTLSVVIKYKFCFSILNVFFMLSGIALGQIKSLRNFAWFANVAVWLNVLVIILTIVGVPVFGPVPTLNGAVEPFDSVFTSVLAPIGLNWYDQMIGMQNAVFAYGGAMIFVEFMAEMRQPRSFWKAAFIAQTFIYVIYMFFGIFIYAYSGQYTYIIASLGINNYAFVTITNVIGLFSGMIAAVLYGNIGIKVLYVNILQAYCKAPDLGSGTGRKLWVVTVIAYWAFAFVIASAIPNLAAMATLVGAFCILQFTYTFPPILYCGYLIQTDASEADNKWIPGMAPFSNRIDSWKDLSRWKRGFRKQWYFKSLLIVIFLGACSFWGLGSYAGVEALITTFASGSSVAFSCRAPGQPVDSATPI